MTDVSLKSTPHMPHTPGKLWKHTSQAEGTSWPIAMIFLSSSGRRMDFINSHQGTREAQAHLLHLQGVRAGFSGSRNPNYSGLKSTFCFHVTRSPKKEVQGSCNYLGNQTSFPFLYCHLSWVAPWSQNVCCTTGQHLHISGRKKDKGQKMHVYWVSPFLF